MKVAISSSGKDLNSRLDPRFGRCAYFLIINPDDMNFEVFNNENSVFDSGAGIQLAQSLASKGVDAVITGKCGPNAAQTFSTAGVELFVGQTGVVEEVVERFKKGKLRPASEATVNGRFGMAPGADSDFRRGMGGSQGMRRKMSGGGGLSGQDPSMINGSGSDSSYSELESLKKKADEITRQLDGIITRINKLETSR